MSYDAWRTTEPSDPYAEDGTCHICQERLDRCECAEYEVNPPPVPVDPLREFLSEVFDEEEPQF